jgi:hypothetical protein
MEHLGAEVSCSITYQEATIYSLTLSSQVFALLFLFNSFFAQNRMAWMPEMLLHFETVLHHRHYVEFYSRGITQVELLKTECQKDKKMYE